MAITVSVYNHTSRLFFSGANAEADTYKILLATSATFTASHTTLASVTYTEVANGNGYTTGGAALTNVTVTTVSWLAGASPLSASKAILYNDSDANDPPLALIDFGQTETAQAGTEFRIVWDINGIFTLTLA
jgi:hypothetical protein